MKVLLIIFAISLAVCVAYLAGPRSIAFKANTTVSPLIDPTDFKRNYVQEAVANSQLSLSIRKGNESKLYWADSAGKKTKYVLLYLHGFSASPEEGAPLHRTIAERYKMNMYAPLLADHGLIEEEPMLNFSAEKYLESAKQALRLAYFMGDSVIIMSTSTGSTAALFLASGENNIHSLICYSPNIKIFDPKSALLAGPWGIHIARLVKGCNYHEWEAPTKAEQYWHLKYRLEALVELQRLLEGTMTQTTFEQVKVPTFVGYYYKNEQEQDSVVSVDCLLEMYDQLGSTNKKKVAFKDVGVHALANQYFSQDIESVEKETRSFVEDILGIEPSPYLD
ncbi:MAG: alpha/beta hydrolase [Bacteroidia bacterium]|jgi:esterase/lipase|nr:alpha/beta hydrolase [Bacteroidia bacterium]